MGKIRKLSPQTVALGLLAVCLVYGGWKFVPPFVLRSQVGEVLEEYKYDAAKLDVYGLRTQRKEQGLLNEMFDRIVELGVDEDRLEVYFDMNYDVITAEYSVVVHHLFGLENTLEFKVEQQIARDEDREDLGR